MFSIGGFGLLGLGFLSVAALVLRFRRSAGEENSQSGLVAAVALAAPLLLVAIVTGWGLEGDETNPLNDLIFFAFFVVLGIGFPAVVRGTRLHRGIDTTSTSS